MRKDVVTYIYYYMEFSGEMDLFDRVANSEGNGYT